MKKLKLLPEYNKDDLMHFPNMKINKVIENQNRIIDWINEQETGETIKPDFYKLSDGKWHHIPCVDEKIFLDGRLVKEAPECKLPCPGCECYQCELKRVGMDKPKKKETECNCDCKSYGDNAQKYSCRCTCHQIGGNKCSDCVSFHPSIQEQVVETMRVHLNENWHSSSESIINLPDLAQSILSKFIVKEK